MLATGKNSVATAPYYGSVPTSRGSTASSAPFASMGVTFIALGLWLNKRKGRLALRLPLAGTRTALNSKWFVSKQILETLVPEKYT